MTAFHRIDMPSRIDRNRPITFTFDGKTVTGFAGDTLASALLANGRILLGRSFKYHRPRGLVGAGVEEPNALFTLGTKGRTEPNAISTTTELQKGIIAKSQNAWPSLSFDMMAVNQRFAPIFGAGFYYKTFMGPLKKSWMMYEPIIRKAAGLGAATPDVDTARYEMRYMFCDVLVVGSGPAGLAAAITAGRAGKRVVLAEQDFEFGGSLLSSGDAEHERWRAEQLAELAAMPDVRLLKRTTVQGLYDGNLAILSHRPENHPALMITEQLRAQNIIMATGAIERPLVFPNNDRPGVMLSSALRALLNRFSVAPKQRAVIVTNNDSAYATAFDLAESNVAVTVAEHRSTLSGDLLARAAQLGIAIFPGCGIADVIGEKQVKAVRLSGRHAVTIECDVLGMSGGWSPAVHLTSHGTFKPVYRADIAAFVPGGFAPGQFGAGAVNGTFGLLAAIAEGEHAARQSSSDNKKLKPIDLPATREDRKYTIQAVWNAAEKELEKFAFVDFQNDVTVKDIKTAHQEGYVSVEHLKRYTTLGMGTDQGKTSNINALAIMADLRSLPMSEAGTTTFRPPYAPFTVGAIAARTVASHFRPKRLSPLHDWHVKNGATFIEAGLWMRAWFYDWAGKTPEEAYIKEMELVRQNVGISDVSTLGKIDVQGKDAAEFLNRVYVNGFAKLPVGRARYGVMLNDDGVVLDDGTTTRISDTQFYMTTTTAQAGEVMSWLEFLLQVHWTDLDVQVTSLTDEWGGMAVSGPNARKALQLALPDVDLSNEGLPYMGVKDITYDGVQVRILRLSFSGELAYEVHCAADYVTALWQHMMMAAEPLGIKPYGLEALASLRIEKGHVAGADLDHRNTLDDLGLGKMAGKEKDYVGKALRFREDCQAPDRWSLVGLECMEEDKKLRGGAILFAASDEIKGHGRGYITSVTWSTELKKYIALALYDGGLKHQGEDIICAFPLKNETVKARIVSPHFVDVEGTRLHA
ncbi:MAG: sarcosine oxidase subunit alpha family protein [Alphaproteobacteria bacterium]|nr:sarcosine oxidase subunit alpha family protein [Alphaproteobacteria bacterium]